MSFQNNKTGNVGIMGGTFNPVHNGHLHIARAALEQFPLETVWFMPNKVPAYKQTADIVDPIHREAMIRLAIQGEKGFSFSSFEWEREGITYTYKTLELLRKAYPERNFYFIMGADSLFAFHHWKNPERVAKNCTILVALRDNARDDELEACQRRLEKSYHARIERLMAPEMAVSSKEIRAMVKEGKNVSSLLPENVLKYIEKNNLYG